MTSKFLTLDAFALARRIRILLVDPDPTERTRLRTGLEPRFWVTEAVDADDAMSHLRGQYFDGILTSFELGARDGARLLHYVWEHHQYVHRALMTATCVPGLWDLLERGIVMICEQKPLAPEHYAAYWAEPFVKQEETPDT